MPVTSFGVDPGEELAQVPSVGESGKAVGTGGKGGGPGDIKERKDHCPPKNIMKFKKYLENLNFLDENVIKSMCTLIRKHSCHFFLQLIIRIKHTCAF